MRALYGPVNATAALLGVIVLSMATSPIASASDADEIDGGISSAQYSCDQQKHSFELSPYNKSAAEHMPLKEDFKQVQDGRSSITCRLGNYILEAQIEVSPPSNSQCGGNGSVLIYSVSVSGIELLPVAPSLDWECVGNDNNLMNLRVVITGADLSVERCYQSDDPNGKNGCATEHINIGRRKGVGAF